MAAKENSWLMLKRCRKEIILGIVITMYMLYNVFNYLGRIIRYNLDSSYDAILWFLNKGALLYFLAALIISFEFFSILNRDFMMETVRSISQRKEESNQVGLLIKIHIVSTLCWLVISLGIYYFLGQNESLYIGHIVSNVVVNIGLNGLLAILLGKCTSAIASGKIRVATFIFLIIMFSGILNQFEMMFIQMNVKLYKVLNIFGIFPRNIDFEPNLYLGYPIQIQRLVKIIIWILLCAIILAAYFTKKRSIKGIIMIGVEAVILIFLIAFVRLPYTNLTEYGTAPNGYLFHAQQYYVMNSEENSIRESVPIFNVTRYDIDLKFKNELIARVEMKVDKAGLDEYNFTLYHEYNVSRVEDQDGNRLPFAQSNDYLLIKPENKNVSSMTVYYSGTGCPFYSEWIGSYLRAGFSYYPIPGFHKVYENYSFINIELPKEIKFHVKVDSMIPVYSNLSKTSKNEFEGTSQGLTLISGMVREEIIEDVTFLTPVLWDSQHRKKQQEDILKSAYMIDSEQKTDTIEGKTIIYLPYYFEYMDETFYRDHFFVISYDTTDFEKNYRKSTKSNSKAWENMTEENE